MLCASNFNVHLKSIIKRFFHVQHQLDHVLIKTIEKKIWRPFFVRSNEKFYPTDINWRSIFHRSYLIQSAWAQNYMCTILLWYFLFRFEFKIPEWEILIYASKWYLITNFFTILLKKVIFIHRFLLFRKLKNCTLNIQLYSRWLIR